MNNPVGVKEILKFSIINDQKSAKLRIKFSSVFEMKNRTRQPKSGKKIKVDKMGKFILM